VGKADMLEEIARLYGYDRIPETQIADRLPPQIGNPALEAEERLRDTLVGLGLQEVVTYRLTSPEREARRVPPGGDEAGRPYIQLSNPITADRSVMRQSLLAGLFEIVERNARQHERLALFEVGPVYLASEEGALPEEPRRLAIVLSGSRTPPAWQAGDRSAMDFYDLKGIVDGLLADLRPEAVHYEPAEHPTFHPGKTARLLVDGRPVGILGEVHPLVRQRYEFPDAPLLAADLDLEALLAAAPPVRTVVAAPPFPPVLEDLAVVVDQGVPAERVESLIRQTGGALVSRVRLFDLYQGDQVGAGKKSLAYAITYQATDRTLTDTEVARLRDRIVRRLESDLGARLRA
jgi:phenylalanyl-tRNA synthetase beta chain